MSVELALSAMVVSVLGAMIIGERRSIPDPKWQKPPGWQGSVQRADLILVAGIVLCLAFIWFPSGGWKR